MITFFRMMAQNGHLVSYLVVSLLYLSCFIFVVRVLSKTRALRNAFTISTGLLFLLVSSLFFVQGIFAASWDFFWLECSWLFLASCPALVFLFARGKSSVNSQVEAMAAAERFNTMKEEFLSVASHELRTPLSVITGFAEILVREKLGSLNDEQKRRVRKILLQSQRLNRIVDELLDLSRIRSGKVEVKKEIFDIVPVLRACLDDHQVVSEQQNIRLSENIPDELPDVSGDLERVTQVVVNLLNNAIKYTGSGGSVTLAAVDDKAKGEVRIEVIDTGIGMTQEDVARVYEEFYRSNDPNARKFSGSGLGLAIVKQLVEAQGGIVGVSSEGPGKGSKFFFTIPIARQVSLKGAQIYCPVPKTAPAKKTA